MGAVVELTFAVGGDESDQGLAEVQDWLRQEPELRGRVTAVARPPDPGQLGAVTDVLLVALGSGGALSVLAASLRTLFAQPRRSDLHITIRDGQGRSVEIDAKRVDDVEALIEGTFGQPG
jgi:hypothetical protein